VALGVFAPELDAMSKKFPGVGPKGNAMPVHTHTPAAQLAPGIGSLGVAKELARRGEKFPDRAGKRLIAPR
jgi:hypothetical protein